MKTLITASRSAATFKLLKLLPGEDIILADYGDVPSAFPGYHFSSLGELNPDTIAHNLLNNCLDLSVEVLIPLYRFEIDAVVKARILFEEFGIRLLLPDMTALNNYLEKGMAGSEIMIVRDDESGNNGVFYKDEQGKPGRLFFIEG